MNEYILVPRFPMRAGSTAFGTFTDEAAAEKFREGFNFPWEWIVVPLMSPPV